MSARDIEDQRAVLAVLARASYPMRRRAIETAAFGATGHMAWRTIRAIRELMTAGYVVDAYEPTTAQFSRCYKATEKGQAHAAGVSVFHPSGAS